MQYSTDTQNMAYSRYWRCLKIRKAKTMPSDWEKSQRIVWHYPVLDFHQNISCAIVSQ